MIVQDDWHQEKLGDLLTLIRNGFSGQQVGNVTDYPVTRIETISNGTIDLKRIGYVISIPDSYLLKPGDILFSNINSVKHIGKVGRVKGGTRLFHGMNLLVLRPADEVDDNFLFYKLVGEKPWFEKMAAQAINQASINQGTLKDLFIELPRNKQEQTKIAEILSTVDSAIEQTETLIIKQQRIKTGLMQDLLSRGIDEHGNIRSEGTHSFKDSSLGRIPVEWDAKELRSCLSYLSYGFTNPMPEAIDGPYMVTAANISNGVVQYDSCRRTSIEAFKILLTNKSRPRIGDILITKDGTLGRLAIVDRVPLCINQSVAVMRIREGVDRSYLKTLLESAAYQRRIIEDAGGSTIKHIYISKIDKMMIALPREEAEQAAIKERLSSQASLVHQLETVLQNLVRLKAALMQDLLNGKKRVTPLLGAPPSIRRDGL